MKAKTLFWVRESFEIMAKKMHFDLSRNKLGCYVSTWTRQAWEGHFNLNVTNRTLTGNENRNG